MRIILKLKQHRGNVRKGYKLLYNDYLLEYYSKVQIVLVFLFATVINGEDRIACKCDAKCCTWPQCKYIRVEMEKDWVHLTPPSMITCWSLLSLWLSLTGGELVCTACTGQTVILHHRMSTSGVNKLQHVCACACTRASCHVRWKLNPKSEHHRPVIRQALCTCAEHW